MPTYNEVRRAIEARWTENYQSTLSCFGDMPFEPPKDNSWARLTIRFGEGLQKDLASDSARIRTVGVIFLQFFSPVKHGTGAVCRLADTAVEIFERQQFDGIQCRSASPGNESPEGHGFYQFTVSIPFFFDRLSAV